MVLLFAAVTFASHFLFPSVRWFFRRRAERVVARINTRLERPIEPFKLARRTDMIQRLIYHPDVMEAVTAYAKQDGVREDVAFEKARHYAKEIVPSFSATAYFGVGIRFAKFVSHALYRVRVGYQHEGLKDIDPEATVVFVMNHRSNVDYLLVTYLASQRSAMSYAVGEWARVWPLSKIVRWFGGFFIRRRSRGILYRRILARYVQMATEGGVTQAVFPEGGLSVTGDIAEPKLGLMSYVVGAFDPEGRDVVFVPVAVNYDRVLEDKNLIAAGKRGDRRFGVKITVLLGFWMKHLWQRITGRYYKFGYAAASFGRPLSLKDRASAGQVLDAEVISTELMDRIGKVMPVLPVPLVASLLIEQPAWSKIALREAVLKRMDQLEGGHLHIPRDDTDYALDYGLRNLASRNIITVTDDTISLNEDSRDLLKYYAASLSHLEIKSAVK